MNIPFANLRLDPKLKYEILKEVNQVIDSQKFILGPKLEKFEKNFAKYIGVKYCIGVNSGSDALFLSLTALGLKKEDEVITVANTFISTADSIVRAGAKPIFADINEKTLNIDIIDVKKKMTKKTKAIIPVHLFGYPAEIVKLKNLAKKYNLKIIEDVAQAIGATYDGKKVGSFGDMACFSFYPSKNIGALGDAGAITTNNKMLFDKLIMLRNYGQQKKDSYKYLGINSRLDEIQAAVLNVKLKHTNQENKKRQKKASLYFKLLPKEVDIISPIVNSQPVYHLMVVKVKKRDELKRFLSQKNIKTRIHYPIPINKQPLYKKMRENHSYLPVTEKMSKNILSLPFFPDITEKQIKYVCQQIGKFYQG